MTVTQTTLTPISRDLNNVYTSKSATDFSLTYGHMTSHIERRRLPSALSRTTVYRKIGILVCAFISRSGHELPPVNRN